jgi:hypothetical protein
MSGRRILFLVLKGVGGYEYTAYDDGSIDGFGEGQTLVFNHWPTILDSELARLAIRNQREENGIPSRLASTAEGHTSDRVGAGHSLPA